MNHREAELAALMRELFRCAADVGHQAGQQLGLGGTDLAALRALDEVAGEPVRVGSLAQRLGLSSAAATALVDRLELAGVVDREVNPRDRRQVLVRLRAEAEAVGESLLADWGARFREAATGLDDAQLAVVVTYVRAVLTPSAP